MRDYPTLHLDTNYSQGAAYSKKSYECKPRGSNVHRSQRVR
jgi:hypothetical protein